MFRYRTQTPRRRMPIFLEEPKICPIFAPATVSPAQSGPFGLSLCDSFARTSSAHLKTGSLSKTASTGTLCPVAFFDCFGRLRVCLISTCAVMKTIRNGKANYCLAARLCGNDLFLAQDVRQAVESEHLRAIRRAAGHRGRADERAFAESVEWERLGDFYLRIGSRVAAVRAYRESALACLDGDCYDHGEDHFPCRFLRLRFLRLAETAACCGSDARLRALLAEEPLLRKEYARLGF